MLRQISMKTYFLLLGDPAGRPRTPPGYRSSSQTMSSSMGPPMLHHRTLPGRGATSRGPPGGPMAGGGGGTMYHQDLAYFDRGAPPMGPRFGGGGVGAMGGRMEPPPAPPQDNKNNFVREWVEVRLFFSHFFGNYEPILLFCSRIF